jgi:hypothetical protein
MFFYALNVLCDQVSNFVGVRRDHEMRRAIDRPGACAFQALGNQCVRALNRRVAYAAPQYQGGNADGRQQFIR